MKKTLIKKAQIHHPDYSDSPIMDVLIDTKGVIAAIESDIDDTVAQVIDGEECILSIGWLDIGTQIGEPGFEHKENLASITNCALAGGYTAIAPFPNTYPEINNRTAVENLRRFSAHNPVNIYPIGGITTPEGKLTEMLDMQDAGAVAFSNGSRSIASSGDLLRALEYVLPFDGLVIDHPIDHYLCEEAEVNESAHTMQMGLKGIPNFAESLTTQRNSTIQKYTNSRLLLHCLTTQESIDVIKKQKNDQLYTSVSGLHLIFEDEAVTGFDTTYKVWPPLRSKKDMKALRKAVTSDVIDIIVSNHSPQGTEEKNLEFGYAEYGAINLQTLVSSLTTHTDIPIENIINKVAYQPRTLLKLEIPKIEIGAKANLTLFSKNTEWTFDKSTNASKSSNSPFLDQTLKGKVLATIHKGKINTND